MGFGSSAIQPTSLRPLRWPATLLLPELLLESASLGSGGKGLRLERSSKVDDGHPASGRVEGPLDRRRTGRPASAAGARKPGPMDGLDAAAAHLPQRVSRHRPCEERNRRRLRSGTVRTSPERGQRHRIRTQSRLDQLPEDGSVQHLRCDAAASTRHERLWSLAW